jgi:hypothetical protein
VFFVFFAVQTNIRVIIMKTIAALFAILGALGLSACTLPGAPAGDASKQFLTERNGGTPVVIGGPGQEPVVAGTVEQVDGSTLTVHEQQGGAGRAVQLGDQTRIRRQTNVSIEAVKPGAEITAVGTRQGDTFEASLLTLGAAGNAPVIMRRAGGSGQSGDTTFTTDGALPDMTPISGTIEQVDGRTITVKAAEGNSQQITLAEGAVIQQFVDAQAAEIRPGSFVLAQGQLKDTTLLAVQVDILPAPQAR